jgi:hypothetical protein
VSVLPGGEWFTPPGCSVNYRSEFRLFIRMDCFHERILYGVMLHFFSGFGGLVVSMLASGTQDRGFKPDQSRRIFSGIKIPSMPSFGREVKQFVPCRRFTARSRTLREYVEVDFLQLNYSILECFTVEVPSSANRGCQWSSRYTGCPCRGAPTLDQRWGPSRDGRRQPK